MAINLAMCWVHKKSKRHRFCLHRTPILVEEAGTEDRIQYSRGQDKLRVLREPGPEGGDENQGGLPAGGNA